MRIFMIETVSPDLPWIENPGTILYAGVTYEAERYKCGGVCGICSNGERLRVKQNEYEIVEE